MPKGPGLHHYHTRKRVYEKLEEYPHPHRFKRFLDRFIYVAGLLVPIVTIPQIIEIWINHNASGVSFSTWLGYTIYAFTFLIYGVIHREKPLIVIYSSMVVLDIVIVIGVFIYG